MLTPQHIYKQKYKQMLSKKHLTRQDIREFNQAVEHYKAVYPDWKETQEM